MSAASLTPNAAVPSAPVSSSMVGGNPSMSGALSGQTANSLYGSESVASVETPAFMGAFSGAATGAGPNLSSLSATMPSHIVLPTSDSFPQANPEAVSRRRASSSSVAGAGWNMGSGPPPFAAQPRVAWSGAIGATGMDIDTAGAVGEPFVSPGKQSSFFLVAFLQALLTSLLS